MWLFGCASVRTITRTLQELIREEHGVSVKFISKGEGGGSGFEHRVRDDVKKVECALCTFKHQNSRIEGGGGFTRDFKAEIQCYRSNFVCMVDNIDNRLDIQVTPW